MGQDIEYTAIAVQSYYSIMMLTRVQKLCCGVEIKWRVYFDNTLLLLSSRLGLYVFTCTYVHTSTLVQQLSSIVLVQVQVTEFEFIFLSSMVPYESSRPKN